LACPAGSGRACGECGGGCDISSDANSADSRSATCWFDRSRSTRAFCGESAAAARRWHTAL